MATAYRSAFERACATELTTVERDVDRDYHDGGFRLRVTLRTTGEKATVNVLPSNGWVPVGPFASPDWASILFEMAHREARRAEKAGGA